MQKILFESILQVLVLIPFVMLWLREKSKINFLRTLIFTGCYIVYRLFLVLPKTSPAFDFIQSGWNWDGKILGIVWAVAAYFLFQKWFRENDFFTLRQHRQGLKSALSGAAVMVVLSTVIWYIFGSSKLNYETLAFQISLPGIDEEMMFRGVLLGLLLSVLKEKIPFLGNPCILITSVLFGFMHALTLDENYAVHFEPVYFLQTGFAGYVWGWITVKSRSILLAVLFHNFSNFFGTLATMIK